MNYLGLRGNMIHKKPEVKNLMTFKRDHISMVIKSRESKKVIGSLTFNFEFKKPSRIVLLTYPFMGEANKYLKSGLNILQLQYFAVNSL